MTKVLFENDGVKCEKAEDFAVFYLKETALDLYLNISCKADYDTFFPKLLSDDSIKGIAFINDHVLLDDDVIGEKIKSIFQSKGASDRKEFERIVNGAWTSSKASLGSSKPIACGIIGTAGYDYLGFSMLYTYRCVSQETSFVNTAYRFGVPPLSLLPFFLKDGVGYAKASEIMFAKESFSAQEALDLGLVQDVVPGDAVQETCLRTLESMARIPKGAFQVMQNAIQPKLKDLEEHMDMVKRMALKGVMYE